MPTNPDVMIAATPHPLRELESRIGIDHLDELQARRHELVRDVAGFRAKYGPFGSADNLRKIELSRIAAIIRAAAVRDGVKLTEAAIQEAAHADARYVEHVTRATNERAEHAILEDQIQAIDERIMRGQALARFAASEAMLAR